MTPKEKNNIRLFYTDMVSCDKIGNRKDNLEEKRNKYTYEAIEEAEKFIKNNGKQYERLCVVFYEDYKKTLKEERKRIINILYSILKNPESSSTDVFDKIIELKEKYGVEK